MSPFGRRSAGLRLERIRSSPRFIEGSFRNTSGVRSGLEPGTGVAAMREYFTSQEQRLPPGLLPSHNPLTQWQLRPASGLRATWLGHSTVLLEIDGWRVLTDPVWGDRASPLPFAGPKRFQPVPVPIASLPPLDAVVISHDHYDHLDLPTIRALAKTPVPFFTALGVGAHLEYWGIPPARIHEMDWWESCAVAGTGLQITAAPAQHFSGRAVERNQSLWSSFALRGTKHSVFFSGDTGLTPEYSEIGQRLGPFDLVLLEVGAFHPAWGQVHLGPEGALQAWRLLGSGAFLPVHWGTFNLAMHAWDEPAEVLLAKAAEHGPALLMPQLGSPIEPAHAQPVEAWWRDVKKTRRS